MKFVSLYCAGYWKMENTKINYAECVTKLLEWIERNYVKLNEITTTQLCATQNGSLIRLKYTGSALIAPISSSSINKECI